jgi:branched-chain amino acid aminotransferase
MINSNGVLTDKSSLSNEELNRAISYGDGLFETMRVRNGKVLFMEDHYLRLMASMRILRMNIPMHFTPEFFQEQAQSLLAAKGFENARLRLQVVRAASAGYYTPEGEVHTSWWMEATELMEADYQPGEGLVVDLFKDHYVQSGLLSTVKSTNSLLYILASIYSKENGFDGVLLVNDQKMLVEANFGNVFIVQGTTLRTAPLTDGALRGVLRKNILEWSKEIGLTLVEESINPFDLQKADELWITNVVKGIQWVRTYRRKEYGSTKAIEMIELINRKMDVLSLL